MNEEAKQQLPPQEQEHQPGRQSEMHPQPESIRDSYRGSGRLDGKVALITGGDSGIGRAVAVHFAREGAKVVIGYLEENKDAAETARLVREEGSECTTVAGDVGDPEFCRELVQRAVDEHGRLDILVNNAAEQHTVEKPEELTAEQVERTFRTNVFAYINSPPRRSSTWARAARSSTPVRSPVSGAMKNSSTMPRRRARSMR